MNLPQLQNLMKRDPASYIDEFTQQWRHFQAKLDLFNMKPDQHDEEFGNIVMFLAQISLCYKEQTTALPMMIVELLNKHYAVLNPELRSTLVKSLILLRNKHLISMESLLSLFFTLFRCPDKNLRQLLHSHIVTDIKNSNQKAKNNKLNKEFQNFMYTMLKDTNEIAMRKSLEVMIDLYKKNVWNDVKTVNVISEACFSPNLKVVSTALHFFLGANKEISTNDSDDEKLDINALKHNMTIAKKTKSRKSQYDRAIASTKKKERAKNSNKVVNFEAVHLIHDPQGFVEKLFQRLKNSSASVNFRFELRMTLLNLITRLVGIHNLILLGLYEFLIPYLRPSQRDVTQILAFAAQASHDLVPPDSIEPVIQAIADNFIWSNCAPEVVGAGLNSLREICSRCPLAMPESLLQSLIADYKGHREKGVMMAARSLLGLFRGVNPEMLKRRDRGKAASIKKIDARAYGEINVATGVDGLDLIAQQTKDKRIILEEAEWEDENDDSEHGDAEDPGEGWEGWEADSEVEDDISNEGWTTNDIDNEPSTDKPIQSVAVTDNIAMQKILTDKDFKKLRSLTAKRDAAAKSGKKSHEVETDLDSENESSDNEDSDAREDGPIGAVGVDAITSGIKRKNTYEERMESIKAGREGREKFGSKKSKQERSSKTNKEKSKMKLNQMMVHKRSVKGKSQRSLRDKQKILRAHITKQKMKK